MNEEINGKMKQCKVCGKEVAKSAKTCPYCGAKLKSKGMGCLIVILVIAFLALIGSLVGGGSDSDDSKTPKNNTQNTDNITSGTDANTAGDDQPNQLDDKITMGQKNALKKANNYLDIMSFSYSGLITQLEFEGFSTEESTYAVDNCGADWNEQAAKKAKSYMEISAFSRDSLIEQLKFEGFTSEQAEYGATAIGY